MTQQYDHSETVNPPLDRSPDVLAVIAELENKGFYQGSDDIELEFKVVTTHNDWEIKAGYTDTLLYLTVSLADGSRWLIDLEDCEDDLLPTNQQLLESNPKILDAQLAQIKQRKYERTMKSVSWVKALIDGNTPTLPSRASVVALLKAGFQYLGKVDDYEDFSGDTKIIEFYEEEIVNISDGLWHLSYFHRDDDLIFLDAVHVETCKFWQYCYSLSKEKTLPQDKFQATKQILSPQFPRSEP